MFGREVAGGMMEVMGLWDAFFELASATASMDSNMSLSNALMNVLKTAAAAMILLIRHLLLAPTVAWDGSLTGDPDPNDGIQYLMNYPPIEDTGVFVKTVTSLLAKERLLTAKSAQNKPSNHQVKPQRFQRMSSDLPIVAIGDQQDQAENDKEETLSRTSSCGDFMAWPQSESNELDVSITIPTGLEFPIVHRRSSGYDEQVDVEHGNKLDISETLGNFAAGLLGLGTNKDGKQQTEPSRRASLKASFNRMSFTGLIGIADNDDKNHSDGDIPNGVPRHDFDFDTHPGEEDIGSEDDENVICVIHKDLNDNSDKKGKVPFTRRHSLSIDSLQNDESVCTSTGDLNASFTSYSSRISASRALSESCRQDPVALAKKLERSVATLMKHFHDQLGAQADTSPSSNGSSSRMRNLDRMIPERIWHAMADIEQVRKDLLSQSATEKLERSQSNLSLFGMEQSNELLNRM
jgi:hypothetical protein